MYSKKDLYIAFLQASSVRYSSNALSDVAPSEISHDALSKWLKTANYRPSEVWAEAKTHINKQEECILLIDDSTIDKRHSEKIEPARYLYSGNAHDVIQGIGLTNLVWHGLKSNLSLPVDFRVYNPDEEGKTKNDHFQEMIKLSVNRGIKPGVIIADTWYSSLANLKMVRGLGLFWFYYRY